VQGQGCDPNMFGAHYLANGWRYRRGYIEEPIGNSTWGIKRSHARYRYVTLESQGRVPDTNISKTDRERGARLEKTTNRK